MNQLTIFIIFMSIYLAHTNEYNDLKIKFKIEDNPRQDISDLIKNHNKKYEKGLTTFKLSKHVFGDLSTEEVLNKFTGHLSMNNSGINARRVKLKVSERGLIPHSVDWRSEGLVTDVQIQGKCGSCWAYSVTGVLEGQYKKKYGKLLKFSEQQLLDCNYGKIKGNWGCDGGLEEIAFDYVLKNGIIRSSGYKYNKTRGSCKYRQKKAIKDIKPYVAVPIDENDLKTAVALIGPISVAVHAKESFVHYSEGIYSIDDCPNNFRSLNHAVLLVGYGKDEATGLDYWIVKNQWGKDWGEAGYIRMRRNHGNMCGIAANALYAQF